MSRLDRPPRDTVEIKFDSELDGPVQTNPPEESPDMRTSWWNGGPLISWNPFDPTLSSSLRLTSTRRQVSPQRQNEGSMNRTFVSRVSILPVTFDLSTGTASETPETLVDFVRWNLDRLYNRYLFSSSLNLRPWEPFLDSGDSLNVKYSWRTID